MALQQKRQMVNNVLFKLDEPVQGRAPTDPAAVQGRLNIRVVPDATDADAAVDAGGAQPVEPEAADTSAAAGTGAEDRSPAGYSLTDLAALLKKK